MNNTSHQDDREPLGTNYEYRVGKVAANIDDAVLYRFWLQSVVRLIAPELRTSKICIRRIQRGKDRVKIVRSPSRRRASFTNLMTCGSVWHCPVCAAKVSERRAAELQKAVTLWHKSYGFVALVTYTMQHDRKQSLKESVDRLTAAFRRQSSGEKWQKLAKEYGIAGSVRALEVTHGSNGWHPHFHQLLFLYPMSSDQVRRLEADGRAHWLRMLRKEGGDGLDGIAYDFQVSEGDVYDYIAKFGHPPKDKHWTLDREVAKAAAKTARKKGKTPVQLLHDAGEGNPSSARLWREYAFVMEGKHQLQWTKELKKLLDIEAEKSDGEIAAAPDSDAEYFAHLTREHWNLIVKLPRDQRAEVLHVCHDGDREALKQWCLVRNIVPYFTDDEAQNGTQDRTTEQHDRTQKLR